MIKEVVYRININNLGRNNDFKNIYMKDIAKVKIRTTGSIILVDETTNETVVAGMIVLKKIF